MLLDAKVHRLKYQFSCLYNMIYKTRYVLLSSTNILIESLEIFFVQVELNTIFSLIANVNITSILENV